MPKGSPRVPKGRVIEYDGDVSTSPPSETAKVPKKPKKKVALAPVRIQTEPALPLQTQLAVKKPFVGQTRQAIDAINRANRIPTKRLNPDLSPGLKKMGACGTVF